MATEMLEELQVGVVVVAVPAIYAVSRLPAYCTAQRANLWSGCQHAPSNVGNNMCVRHGIRTLSITPLRPVSQTLHPSVDGSPVMYALQLSQDLVGHKLFEESSDDLEKSTSIHNLNTLFLVRGFRSAVVGQSKGNKIEGKQKESTMPEKLNAKRLAPLRRSP
jgi:hypothetical protein